MHHRTMRTLSAAALVGVGAAGASGSRRIKLGGKHNSVPATDALLQQAQPYKKSGAAHRRLDQNFQVDGSYSLKFSQCVDVKLYDRDLFDENVVSYTKKGQIISTKSYALVHVCQGDNCYYESEDDLYLIPLSTYVMNAASYHATVQSSYCDACDTYYNSYCLGQNDDANNQYAGDDAAAANDDAAGDDGANDDAAANYYQGDDAAGDDAARRLSPQHRRTTQYIDCKQCKKYGCVNNNDDGQQQQGGEGENGVVEMINDLANCLNTGLNWNDDQLYVGFMCSPDDGDGVELAVFLDNECTVYTNTKAFEDIPSWYIYRDEDLFTEAATFIKTAFSETTPCLYEEFGNPAYQSDDDDDANQNYGDDGYQANYQANYETNEYCQNIFEEGVVDFGSCGQDDDQNQNNNNENGQGDDDSYSWYTFDMDYNDSENLDQVCSVLQQLEGEYEYQYDVENSGTWNGKSGWGRSSKSGNKSKWGFISDKGAGFSKSGMMILLYVVLGVAVVVGVLFGVGVYERRKRDRMDEPVYSGGRLV
ncbi:hypothetical protein ACHAXT_007062 [Thalassiosira profunda]